MTIEQLPTAACRLRLSLEEAADELAMRLLAEVRVHGAPILDRTFTSNDGATFTREGMALIRSLAMAANDTLLPGGEKVGAAPAASVGWAERSLADYMGEAFRRWHFGLIRPLWQDMPEEGAKAHWRTLGRDLARHIEAVGLSVVARAESS